MAGPLRPNPPPPSSLMAVGKVEKKRRTFFCCFPKLYLRLFIRELINISILFISLPRTPTAANFVSTFAMAISTAIESLLDTFYVSILN